MTDNQKQKLCFVVGPIGAAGSPERTHADWLLKGIIQPVFSEHFADFDVVRADKISAPGMIDSQVITMLIDADLVIADMSFLNANAFYEMGIRHMLQKPIIHMFRDGDTIPFDVAPYRAIKFSHSHPDDHEAARVALKAAIDEVIKPDFEVENPVTRARGAVKVSEHATPEIKLIMDALNSIKAQVDQIGGRTSGLRDPVPIYDIGVKTYIRVSASDDAGDLPNSRVHEISELVQQKLGTVTKTWQGGYGVLNLEVLGRPSPGPHRFKEFPDLSFEVLYAAPPGI